MPQISINNKIFNIDGIVFDKDGTLIDFNATWGPFLKYFIENLVTGLPDKENITQQLFHSLGVDPQTLNAHDGPYAISTFDKICTIISSVLYQNGVAWTKAEQHVLSTYKLINERTSISQWLAPVTDIAQLFATLQANEIKIGVATADNRQGTTQTLKSMGCDINELYIACGDDDHLPAKPDPALLLQIAQHWHTTVDKIAMVGDTVGDVFMAREAKAISIGVLTGAGNEKQLKPFTDIVIKSIESIKT